MPGEPTPTLEAILLRFLLRFLVAAGKQAAARCWQTHDEAPLAVQLLDDATAIEVTLDVWEVMERRPLRELFKPITFGPSCWEKAR